MPFNGTGTFIQTNGTFTGANVWAQDKAAGVNIVTSRHDTHDQDVANGLSSCITKNGETTVTGNIPFNGFKLTGVGAGTALTDAVNVGQIQNSTSSYGGLSTGLVNTFAVTLTPAITSYVAGQRVQFKCHLANTGASTLNVNGVGAANIIKNTTLNATIAGDIPAGEIIDCIYDGTNFQLQNQPSTWSSDWLPAATGTGSMTYTGVTDIIHRYQKIGTLIYCSMYFTGTCGGSLNNTLQFSLPVASKTGQTMTVMAVNGGPITTVGFIYTAASTTANFQLVTGNFLSTAGGEGVNGNFFYEAA